MSWIDTHAHLDCRPLAGNGRAIVARAIAAGVTRFLVPGIIGDVTVPADLPGVFRAWGVHPWWAGDVTAEGLTRRFEERRYAPVAIGECGLDSRSEVPLARQIELFARQLTFARRLHLPVLIHLRGCWGPALDLLSREAFGLPWILHAFSGSWEVAQTFLAQGAFISFAGSLCRGNARKTPRVAGLVPSDRILLETDSPDLPPAGWLGPDNEPASLPLVARRVAELRGMALGDLEAVVGENTRRALPGMFP